MLLLLASSEFFFSTLVHKQTEKIQNLIYKWNIHLAKLADFVKSSFKPQKSNKNGYGKAKSLKEQFGKKIKFFIS